MFTWSCGTRMVWPLLASSYGLPDFCSESTIAPASLVERLLNRIEYVGVDAQRAKK